MLCFDALLWHRIPQAYAEAYVPVGNGLNVKAGHFYTPIGYESVPAPDNFFIPMHTRCNMANLLLIPAC